jgi:predicted DNA-binding transcriptional regulator AlpA
MESPENSLTKLAVSIASAARLLEMSRASVYRIHETDPTFPRIRKFGRRASRLLLADLEKWAQRQAGGGNG